jgi:hypothetical protein
MNSARFVLIGFFLSLFSTLAAAQTTTGYPPYGSFEVGVFDGVNRGNLNTNFSIPVTHFKGRGLDVNVALVYDSLLWHPTASAWTPADPVTGQINWGWRLNNVLGSTSFKNETFIILCGTVREPKIRFFDYSYVDPAGTTHP